MQRKQNLLPFTFAFLSCFTRNKALNTCGILIQCSQRAQRSQDSKGNQRLTLCSLAARRETNQHYSQNSTPGAFYIFHFPSKQFLILQHNFPLCSIFSLIRILQKRKRSIPNFILMNDSLNRRK